MNSFANMLNRKIFVRSNRTSYIAVEQSFLVQNLKSFVGKIWVDQDWYVTYYPDVKEAIESGVCKDAKEHYCMHGYYEHRMPYRIIVDESWYTREYDDIRQAVSSGAFESGQAHFESVGFKEGRFPFPHFALKQEDEEVVV